MKSLKVASPRGSNGGDLKATRTLARYQQGGDNPALGLWIEKDLMRSLITEEVGRSGNFHLKTTDSIDL